MATLLKLWCTGRECQKFTNVNMSTVLLLVRRCRVSAYIGVGPLSIMQQRSAARDQWSRSEGPEAAKRPGRPGCDRVAGWDLDCRRMVRDKRRGR